MARRCSAFSSFSVLMVRSPMVGREVTTQYPVGFLRQTRCRLDGCSPVPPRWYVSPPALLADDQGAQTLDAGERDEPRRLEAERIGGFLVGSRLPAGPRRARGPLRGTPARSGPPPP